MLHCWAVLCLAPLPSSVVLILCVTAKSNISRQSPRSALKSDQSSDPSSPLSVGSNKSTPVSSPRAVTIAEGSNDTLKDEDMLVDELAVTRRAKKVAAKPNERAAR